MIPTSFKERIIKCKDPSKCMGDLLFIHGYCVDYNSLTATEDLSEHFNVYMINLPGHGDNTEGIEKYDLTLNNFANYVIEYIKLKKLDNFYLMGHSMGGAVVSLVENQLKGQIKKLILICPMNWAGLFLGIKSRYIFFPKNMEQKKRLLRCLFSPEYLAKVEQDPSWDRLSKLQLDWQLANWDNMKYLFRKQMSSLKVLLAVRRAQKSITTPTLLMVGKYDKIISAKHTLNGFKRYINKDLLTYHYFENSGHLVFMEEKEVFIQKIIEFVKQ